jgi:hypothetical protein
MDKPKQATTILHFRASFITLHLISLLIVND